MPNAVTEISAAPSADAVAYFSRKFELETDCWDVHQALSTGDPGFVLLDVRSPALFAKSHAPGAVNLPHGKITRGRMDDWPEDTLFVVYCAGPHCNGADRAALKLARLGRPVKVMPGGVTGWADEGFVFARAEDAA
jgi:rhodanese-related sulfurtransferase